MERLLSFLNSPVLAQDKVKVPPGMPFEPAVFYYGLIPGLIRLLFLVAFVLAFIFLLWGGISWITSGGNKEALEGARKKVTYAILGLILVLLSYLLIFTFGDLFGVGLRAPSP